MGLLLLLNHPDDHTTHLGEGSLVATFSFLGTGLWVRYSNLAEYTSSVDTQTNAIYTHGPTSVETEHRR